MGCSSSVADRKSENVIRAAILIQKWYRFTMARLEMRRRYSLSIFQSIEYADEQDQLQVCDLPFFLFNGVQREILSRGLLLELEQELVQMGLIAVPDSYYGPRLSFPLTVEDANALLHAFRNEQLLHARYVLQLLSETRRVLKEMPNITHLSTSYSKEITVCGDLHGNLDDLLLIFYKNGLPSEQNPYVFNGDFVDRGKNSMEILIILFILGVGQEISEYILQDHWKQILSLLRDVFSWLPLATIIDSKVLILHGGISDTTDLDFLNALERNKVRDHIHVRVILFSFKNFAIIFLYKWNKSLSPKEHILDILWSDPRSQNGCTPNKCRGGGCYFGPDVTAKLFERYNLKMLIRSHEFKPEGYEISHDGKVITIFSASNYYEEGSNRGAYIKLNPELTPRFVQYQVSKLTRRQNLRERVGTIESSALKSLREKIYAHRSELISAFAQYDTNGTGRISVNDWAAAMESVLQLELPWRMLRSQLAQMNPDGEVDFMSCFYDLKMGQPIKEAQPALAETLCRYRKDLEIIFNIIDKDHSGLISLEEFSQTWRLFTSHLGIDIQDDSIDKLVLSIDYNKDGHIDFNEFLEAFHVVHRLEKKATS
uniref:Serine/threonine-protein phosphatase with EF-hands 1 n=1 Tax=Junco hyemalis TaxID=40217 RepID=A0A8C5NMY7_JUNHY